MSASRQKSCNTCVRSKRKCDNGFPKCRRCTARKLDCEYSRRQLARLAQNSEKDGDGNSQCAESLPEGITPGSLQLQHSPTLMHGFTPYLTDPFLDLGSDPFNLPSLPLDDFLNTAVVQDIMADQDAEDAEVVAGTIYQARVEFAARRIAAVPKTFTETAQTMFIHRRYFQEKSPQVLQDALSACALYCLKTPDTQALVFRNLENKAQQLIANTDPFRISRPDLLAVVQALLLYQIIRLFDGDIRLRAQAEVDEVTIMTWVDRLRSCMRPVAPSLPPATEALLEPQHRAPDWLQWLLDESIRRTVCTAIMVKGFYDFLKYGYDKAHTNRIGFTAQAALWNAQSEYGWRTAYRERERLEVRLAHWEEDIAKAAPDDLEELGVLTMLTFKGVEGTAEWLGEAHIAKYGLE